MSLRAKLILCLGFFLGLLLLLTSYGLWKMEEAIEQEAGKLSSRIALEIAERLGETLHNKADMMESFFWQPGKQDLLRTQSPEEYSTRHWLGDAGLAGMVAESMLSRELGEYFIDYYEATHGHAIFSWVRATDADGRILGFAGQYPPTANARETALWQALQEDRYYVSPVYQDPDTGVHGLVIGVRLTDQAGLFRGIVYGFLRSSYLLESSVLRRPGSYATRIELLSQDGRLLYSNRSHRFNEDYSQSSSFLHLDEAYGWFPVRESGHKEIVGYAEVGQHLGITAPHWFLLVRNASRAVLSESRLLVRQLFWGGVVLVLLGTITAIYLYDSVLIPIRSLQEDMDHVRQGNLQHRAEVKNLYEMGRLASGFNAMLEILAAAQQDLQSQVQRRKQTEDKIQVQYTFLETLIETIPVPIFYKDLSGRYLGCNRAFETLMGHKRDALLGKSVFDISPPTMAMIYDQQDQELYAQGGVQVYESEVMDLHGERRSVIFHKTTFHGQDGETAGLIGVMLDITESKRAANEILIAQERFDQIANTVRDVFWIRRYASGAFLYLNPAAETVWGLLPNRFLRDHNELSVIIHADDRPAYEQAWQSLSETRQYEITYRIRHADGTRWMRETATLVSAGSAGEWRVVGVTHDDTERHQNETRIHQSEALYRTLVRNLPERVCLKNQQLAYLSCNPAFAEALGQNPEDIHGLSDFDLFPYMRAETIRKQDQKVLDSGDVIEEEWQSDLDGVVRWYDTIRAPYYDEGGAIIGVLGIERDITQRKQAEQELQRYRQELEELVGERTVALKDANEALRHEVDDRKRFAMEAAQQRDRAQRYLDIAGVLIVILDRSGCVQLINPRGREILGRPESEILGLDWFDNFIPLELQIEVADVFRQIMRGEVELVSEVEGEVVTAQGTRRRIRWHNTILTDETGRIEGTLSSGADITEEYAAAEALRKSNEELEQFAYIASHDLQEPLRTMSSYVGLIEKRYGEALDERGHKYMQYIVNGCERLRGMIRDLLDFSRAGTSQLSRQDIQTNTLVDEVLSDYSQAVEEAQARIVCQALPEIYGDPGLLRRVFQNLIGNALKFRKEDVPTEVRIQGRLEAGNVVISVQDNGLGIEQEYQKKIFQIFRRLHTIQEYQGSGIGLAISKRIIERHGGRLWVESDGINGSTFSFALPLQAEASEDD